MVRQVDAHRKWLGMTDPSLSLANNKTFTAFNHLQSQLVYTLANTPSSAALTLSTLLTLSLTTVSPLVSSSGSGDCYWWRDLNSIGTNNYSLNVRLKQYRLGHGYGANNLTVSMSLFILTLYSAVALTHFIYLAWTGFHSSTWDSVSKVVALAVNSQSAYELHKTCAGIRQTQVCANPVRITVTTENYDDHVLEVDSS